MQIWAYLAIVALFWLFLLMHYAFMSSISRSSFDFEDVNRGVCFVGSLAITVFVFDKILGVPLFDRPAMEMFRKQAGLWIYIVPFALAWPVSLLGESIYYLFSKKRVFSRKEVVTSAVVFDAIVAFAFIVSLFLPDTGYLP